MNSLHRGWEDTQLWKELNARPSETAKAVVIAMNGFMPDIQRVLRQGGTAPLDFTLHDDGHSFRVAERMAEIVPKDVLTHIGDYEIALLILSAYLHDIGMTPERNKVEAHYRFLLTGGGDLTPTEKAEFQGWLDDQGQSIQPPLTNHLPLDERLTLAKELTTYYSRYRHNDWSETWIQAHLNGKRLGLYSGWISDLIRLCRSHHEGYQDLIGSAFNPRLVGSPPQVVHLRYLAAVLRIADVLEMDPERTPEVILRHRGIKPDSLIYWWKDQDISLKMEGDRLVVHARPESARIHRAIEETLNQIDEELSLCQRLASETHFEICPGLDEPLPHRWELQPRVHRNVESRDGAYEYIDGSFRPNTRKVLELLSGTALYKEPLAAIRELLQNAFDAVREQIAYERLDQPNPADPCLEYEMGTLHSVELRVELSQGQCWIVCSDDGIGMTKSIIRDHLLVSGEPRRRDILELERLCQQAGFQLGRTGQFGIGVLSYFMIADQITIRTLRSQQAGDAETTGWVFQTEGIGSFGELRQQAGLKRGTEVRLLVKQYGTPPEQWPTEAFERCITYVKTILVRLPCKFRLIAPKCKPLVLEPGWAPVADRQDEWIPKEFRPDSSPPSIPFEQLPSADQKRLQIRQDEDFDVFQQIRETLRWMGPVEGELPNNFGSYQLRLPYFELSGGASLAFFRAVEEDGHLRLRHQKEGRLGLKIAPKVQIAWKGVGCSLGPNEMTLGDSTFRPVWGWIDWKAGAAGQLAVDRDTLRLSPDTSTTIQWLRSQALEMVKRFLTEKSSSVYHSLNIRMSGINEHPSGKCCWIQPYQNERPWEEPLWEEVRYPVVTPGPWGSGPVCVAGPLSVACPVSLFETRRFDGMSQRFLRIRFW